MCRRCDAVDAVMGDGNGVDLRLAGLGVIDHRVAAGINFSLLHRIGVALLGASQHCIVHD